MSSQHHLLSRPALGNVNPNTVGQAAAAAGSAGLVNKNPVGNMDSAALVNSSSIVSTTMAATNPNDGRAGGQDAAEEDPSSMILQQGGETIAMEWKDAQKDMDHLFEDCLKNNLKGMKMIKMPSVFQKNGVTLYPHQIEGIRFLTHREKTNQQIAPYYSQRKYGSVLYWSDKIQSGRVNTKEKPEVIRSSVLADEMGLGKTIQTIGLILSSRPNGIRSYPIKNDMPDVENNPRCTLIVAPVSVMANWAMEIDRFVNQKKTLLKIEFYQGPRRDRTLAKVHSGSLDVLLVSFETVAADLKKLRKFKSQSANTKKKGDNNDEDDESDEDRDSDDTSMDIDKPSTLFDTKFLRMVIDEAHNIRNVDTLACKACKRVVAKHHLALTGTPFINNPGDIQGLFSILRVAPLDDKQVFKEYIQDPIQERKEIGLSKLRLALASVCLRRTKESVEHNLELVSRTVVLQKIPFSGQHKEVHNIFYKIVRSAFLALVRSNPETGFGKKAFALFGLMLRCRQACCHGSLIVESDIRAIEEVFDEFDGVDPTCITEEGGIRLYETLVDAIHKSKAPRDDNAMDIDEPNRIVPRNLGRSPKVQVLIDSVRDLPQTEKVVVFSQWTGFLNYIGNELDKEGIHHTRIDGSMDANKRLESMKLFETEERCDAPDNPKVMLCSMKACGTGINLTRANHVFLMDPWWNSAQETQAMDRVHRIGQARPVRVHRLIMQDSIEEKIINVQEAKQTLGKGVLQRLKKEERGKAKVTALADLFELNIEFMDWEGVFDDENEDDGMNLRDMIMGD